MLGKFSRLVALLVVVCHINGQKTKDELIADIFGNNNNNSNNPGTGVASKNQDNNPGGVPGTGTCTCVAYYLCNNGTINTNGENIIDIRVSDDNPCNQSLDVCCEPKDTLDKPPPITNPKGPDGNQGNNNNNNNKQGCGYRNPDGVGFRITGGKDNEAQFGEFPWMVAVLREEGVSGSDKLTIYQCGGSLINTKVVLTAAHCVSDRKKSFKIRAGEWDTQTDKELYPHQDRNVESIVSHPDYYAGALYNDVALLFLDSPVEISETVNVACLPPQDLNMDRSRCFASGWGKDLFGKEGKYQVILKKIDLPVVPRDECQTNLRTTRLGKHFELHKSFICAGGERGKDTCKGDGGSPLVCPIEGEENRYQQAGIVAWGIGCGDNTPGVYANVALFRNWINEQFALKNIETTPYQY